jgi:hypothetical protein
MSKNRPLLVVGSKVRLYQAEDQYLARRRTVSLALTQDGALTEVVVRVVVVIRNVLLRAEVLLWFPWPVLTSVVSNASAKGKYPSMFGPS